MKNNGTANIKAEKHIPLSRAYAMMGPLKDGISLQSVRAACREDDNGNILLAHKRSGPKEKSRIKVRPSVLRAFLEKLTHKSE